MVIARWVMHHYLSYTTDINNLQSGVVLDAEESHNIYKGAFCLFLLADIQLTLVALGSLRVSLGPDAQ